MSVVMTSNQAWAALELRYPKKEYALLSEVRNSTGFSGQARTADAIALSLWPSRGLTMHGFEMKAYRGDWKREKDNPEKAEEIARYCDFWWLLVTDARIVEPISDVPENWGVLGPNKDGTRLAVLKDAVKLEAQPLSRSFVAAILRNVSNATTPTARVAAKCEEARLLGIQEGEKRAADIVELERLRKLEEDVRAFEEASGVQLVSHYKWQTADPKKLGAALKEIMSETDSLRYRLESLDRLAQAAESMADGVRKQRARIVEASRLIAPADALEVSA